MFTLRCRGRYTRSTIRLGGQNAYFASEGAYTGEVSCAMLKDLACTYVILGHSERRAIFGETDELVNQKVKAVLAAGLTPIVCVGETLNNAKPTKQNRRSHAVPRFVSRAKGRRNGKNSSSL